MGGEGGRAGGGGGDGEVGREKWGRGEVGKSEWGLAFGTHIKIQLLKCQIWVDKHFRISQTNMLNGVMGDVSRFNVCFLSSHVYGFFFSLSFKPKSLQHNFKCSKSCFR